MQTSVTALLVEDDPQVAATLRRHLARAGFVVHEAGDEREAVRRVEEIAPDVVILDLPLDSGGANACRGIRDIASGGDVPLLVLSAAQDMTTKLAAFELGADDFVLNTCDPSELVARVRAILRRGSDRRTVRRIGPLRIALATGDAWLAERQLELTNGERAVLVELARAYPGLTSRTALDRRPDQEHEVSSNVTEVMVARLRRKIAAAGGGVEINAVRRSGYVLRPVTRAAEVPV
jgi:DNA-binding response OmpR family regulator